MVIDELIAKLGFKVEGLAALRDAARRLKEFAKSVVNTLNPLKRAAAATNPLKKSMQDVARATVPATSAMARFGTVAKASLVGVLGTATAVAASLIGVAVIMVAIGSKAARARREAQFKAEGQGTSENRLNLLRNTFAATAGVGEKIATALVDDLVSGITDKTKLALAGDAEAKQELARIGINPRGKDGRPADTSALALQAASRIIAENQRAEALRGKGKTKQANLVDEQNNKVAADLGIKDELLAFLKTFKSVDALVAAMAKTAPNAPGLTTEQDARAKGVAQQAEDLRIKLDTLGESFKQFAIILADVVLPPLNKFFSGVLGFAKAVGWANKTREEQDQSERDAAATAELNKQKMEEWARNREIEGRPSRGKIRSFLENNPPYVSGDELRARNRQASSPSGSNFPPWLNRFGKDAGTFLQEQLNTMAIQGINRNAEMTATVKPDQITAKADVGVKTDVSVKVEPTSEFLKAVASAKSAGAMIGSMATSLGKSNNSGRLVSP